jgi:hypothetical protein
MTTRLDPEMMQPAPTPLASSVPAAPSTPPVEPLPPMGDPLEALRAHVRRSVGIDPASWGAFLQLEALLLLTSNEYKSALDVMAEAQLRFHKMLLAFRTQESHVYNHYKQRRITDEHGELQDRHKDQEEANQSGEPLIMVQRRRHPYAEWLPIDTQMKTVQELAPIQEELFMLEYNFVTAQNRVKAIEARMKLMKALLTTLYPAHSAS